MTWESTPELERAESLLGKEHVSIIGRAGVGKSMLLRRFRTSTGLNVAVVAPSNVAAVNVQGMTIHRFFGFGVTITLGVAQDMEVHNPKVLGALDVLIIDEISMVSSHLLDCIDAVLRNLGPKPSLPFGGVKLALFGDPYQLPPVHRPAEEQLRRRYGHFSKYFFDAHSYRDIEKVILTKAFRQSNPDFLDVLDRVRDGSAAAPDLSYLSDRVVRSIDAESYVDATSPVLASRNDTVDQFNEQVLDYLPGRAVAYEARRTGSARFQTHHIVPPVVMLKLGARVMLRTNTDMWVNGSMGHITALVDDNEVEVELDDGDVVTVTRHTWDEYDLVPVDEIPDDLEPAAVAVSDPLDAPVITPNPAPSHHTHQTGVGGQRNLQPDPAASGLGGYRSQESGPDLARASY
jgi:ATP-dependent DNA helicase PIF1